MHTEFTNLLGHCLGSDPRSFRRLVAAAAHDVASGAWRIDAYADPRKRIDELRDLLIEDIAQHNLERKDYFDFAGAVVDALLCGRISGAPRTVVELREIVGMARKGYWDKANADLVEMMVEMIVLTGSSSPVFDQIRKVVGEHAESTTVQAIVG